jgi:hypothetical protein
MTEAEDRTQLGLTPAAATDRDEVTRVLKLPSGVDAYRLGIAAAVAKQLDPAPDSPGRTTAYGVGTLDPDGSIRTSVLALRDDHHGRPYALVERLAEAGLRDLADHLDRALPIRDYLESLLPRTADEAAT